MKEKCINNYLLGEKIVETNEAVLYKALKSGSSGEEDELVYVIKEYENTEQHKGALAKERRITQEIENYASKSIVIPILEVISQNEKEYAVMQFRKNGKFLKELIAELEQQYGIGNIPLDIQLSIIEEILQSLMVLHSFEKEGDNIGYLHLDLHPGNIFLESADIKGGNVGKAKFIDFYSSVKMKDGVVEEEPENMVYMMSRYSSPEQLNRETYKYRKATDLFSVAAIFLRMLEGNLCLEDDDILSSDLRKNFKQRYENPVMEHMLLAFLECAMHNSPMYRYAEAQRMLQALEKLRECNKAYIERDYYSLFSLAYEMGIETEKLNYSKLVIEEQDQRKFQNAVIGLQKDLRTDHINVPRCKYLFQALWEVVILQEENIPNTIKFSLLNSGITCANHTGDEGVVWKLYDKLQECKDGIPIMEYLGFRSREAVMYADAYEYETAYRIVEDNIQNLECLKKLYLNMAKQNNMNSEDSVQILDLGRSYSALGTYMVYTGRKNPMEMFQKALVEFGGNIGNRMFTISHILQYAIETKDLSLYQKYEKEYFGEYQSINKGIDSVLDEKGFDKFQLLTFLKGIYTFYRNKLDRESEQKFIKMLTYEPLIRLRSHPKQLIYRYIGLLLYEIQGEVSMEVEDAFEVSMNCLREGQINVDKNINIMMCITYQTMYLYNELTEPEEENQELFKIMKEHCARSRKGFQKMGEDLKERGIKQILTYEYC